MRAPSVRATQMRASRVPASPPPAWLAMAWLAMAWLAAIWVGLAGCGAAGGGEHRRTTPAWPSGSGGPSPNAYARYLEASLLHLDGRHAEAAAALRLALTSSQDSYLYARLAAELCELGRLDEAARVAGEGIERDPGCPEAWLALGVAREGMGEPMAAREAYEQSLRLGPQVEQRTELEERLRRLQPAPASGPTP